MSRTSSRRIRLTAALGAAATLVLAGCSSSATGGGDGVGFVTGKGGIDTASPAERIAAPDIGGTSLDGGGGLKLSDYRGKVVVLNIWGSWCSPCRAEAKGLQESSEKYGDQVQFLGINTRDTDPANAVAFEKNFGVTYPSIYDPDGAQILKFPKGSLNPQSIPTTIVVDKDGRLAARAMHALSAEDLQGMVDRVLAESK
ncbi:MULTISPECIES: TlpA disulfide reductase family protein [Kitasatospora]|uniref:Putative thiol-disulfide oxidoreductase n=1 Tax=Kitasatospora setae (strain ATCC 33774 / DSM 43861 / JCM 3304 / KCC A-0304 / NBRC 14216 / KM-6054) TaxID=452652 RepID=E4ND57_KITSK|nr:MULTISPECIES: TlpA disulfide reductase family protein [Kitasatospora]BAJ29138.1 putative thiol-disulfide oxidoreductase [Kitasatospora setae KM-6054]